MNTEVKAVGILMAAQAVLYGLARVLETFKDHTSTNVDNRAHSILGMLLTGIDIITGNREHKEHAQGLTQKEANKEVLDA